MKLQSGPSKRSRQERALERRRKEFDQWANDTKVEAIAQRTFNGVASVNDRERKLNVAATEIQALERKLGVRHDG